MFSSLTRPQAEVASYRQKASLGRVYAPSVLCGERAPTAAADAVPWWTAPESRAVTMRALKELPYCFQVHHTNTTLCSMKYIYRSDINFNASSIFIAVFVHNKPI